MPRESQELSDFAEDYQRFFVELQQNAETWRRTYEESRRSFVERYEFVRSILETQNEQVEAAKRRMRDAMAHGDIVLAPISVTQGPPPAIRELSDGSGATWRLALSCLPQRIVKESLEPSIEDLRLAFAARLEAANSEAERRAHRILYRCHVLGTLGVCVFMVAKTPFSWLFRKLGGVGALWALDRLFRG